MKRSSLTRRWVRLPTRIIPEVKAWQNRPLEDVYCIMWFDAMHYKVRTEGRVEHKALYNILCINRDGHKQVLGAYISESEGANFWLRVLTDMQNRGLKDYFDCLHRQPYRIL